MTISFLFFYSSTSLLTIMGPGSGLDCKPIPYDMKQIFFLVVLLAKLAEEQLQIGQFKHSNNSSE